MCLTPDAPNAGEVGSDYQNLVNQFSRGVPGQLSTEQLYKPGFIDTTLSGINQSLFGANGTPGTVSDYSKALPTVAGAEAGANTVARAYNVGDVAGLGRAAADAVSGVNPAQTALTRALTKTASTQLAAGTQLTPGEADRITRTVRGDWASRGLGDSNPAQLDEALQLYGGGQQTLAQREAAASNAIGIENQNITLPALSLATATSGAPGSTQNLVGGAGALTSGAGASLVPTGELSDVLSTVYNAQSAANISGANNKASLIGSALSY